MARYMTRTPVALAKVFHLKDGRVKLLTPRDPKTGLDHRLFDPLDWVHAITTQIPDPRQHLTRYQGAYANTKGTQTSYSEPSWSWKLPKRGCTCIQRTSGGRGAPGVPANVFSH